MKVYTLQVNNNYNYIICADTVARNSYKIIGQFNTYAAALKAKAAIM